MTRSRFIFIVIVLVILQGVLNLSLSVSTYLFLAPICFVLLGFERGVSAIKCMVLAFIIGLAVDMLSCGVPGLWSASLTAAALPRLGIIRRRAWEDDSDFYDMPIPKEMGFGIYAVYALAVNAVFYLSYVMVERMTLVLNLFDGVRILVSVVTNTVILLIIAICVQDNRRY